MIRIIIIIINWMEMRFIYTRKKKKILCNILCYIYFSKRKKKKKKKKDIKTQLIVINPKIEEGKRGGSGDRE